MFTSDLATLLLVPPGLAGLSAVYLFLKFLISHPDLDEIKGKSSVTSTHRNSDPPEVPPHNNINTLSETVQEFDGTSIILFRILRLLVIAALLAVQIFDVTTKGGHVVSYLHLVVFVS